ncbi:Acyltransferase family protein [Ekhidna lutea]|uniref:Acyltransferase family protein n=1 Tax=Ekhidna lutea TaxID=447679 RepID=A0A239HUF3_EKHLU|nr:acyltransferase [Ekhidna lutea]SNS84929.1 Acyltransferase family protein [Ekhidna lutea]
MTERRYDIDWLRVIAIGLLLVYHVAIAFQPWGVFIGFIQNNDTVESIWTPMSMLNVWRIPLLFYVSGMGVYFAMKRRNWKELIMERSKRILLPFLFGMTVIVPVHVLMWQGYYHQPLSYEFSPGHLWFLGNIFIYVLVLLPIFLLLRKVENDSVSRVLDKIFKTPVGVVILIIPFVAEAMIVKPENFEMYAFSTHGFWLGLCAFFLGFICMMSQTFWPMIAKWRWLWLGVAITFYLIRWMIFNLQTPDYAMAIESSFWIFAVFGFGNRHLNKPSKSLVYLSESAYPIYIIHMLFIYLGSLFFFSLNISGAWTLTFLTLFTFLGCFISYEFLIRRVAFLRPLFGLKQVGK